MFERILDLTVPHPAFLVIMRMLANTQYFFSSRSGSEPELMSRISVTSAAGFCKRDCLNDGAHAASAGTLEVLRHCFVFECLSSKSAGKATRFQATAYNVGQSNAKVKAQVPSDSHVWRGRGRQPASAKSPRTHV